MNRNTTEIFAFVCLFILLFGYVLTHPDRINHDVAILLQSAELLWEGNRPYVDFIELDPPLIFYVGTFPVMLGRLLHVPMILMLSLCVATLNLWSAWAIKRILEGMGKENGWVLAIAFGIFSLFFLKTLDWGQRDYLFTLAFVPYLLVRYVHNTGGRVSTVLAVATGLLTGLFFFKQYFLLLVLVPEVYFLLKRKWQPIAPETLALFIVLLLYLVHFFFLPEAMVSAYFKRWVPMLVKYYDTYDISYGEMFAVRKVYLLLGGICALLSLALRRFFKTPVAQLLPLLSWTVLAALGVFYIQHKGFLYHLLPAMGVTSLILGIWCAEGLRFLPRWLGSIAFVCLGLIFLILLAVAPRVERTNPLESTIAQYSKENDRVLIISTSIATAYPITVQMHRPPGSRYLTSFPIAFLMKEQPQHYPTWEEASPQLKQFIQELKEDINTLKPQLILINDTNYCQACPVDFNIYQFLTQIGLLEPVLKTYTRKPDSAGYAVLKLL